RLATIATMAVGQKNNFPSAIARGGGRPNPPDGEPGLKSEHNLRNSF
ncbi:hypothetical protein IQ225_12300, partial [Synechocystis salina LEGE 06155]|nr:hypothetical protein [Synechocystis salina LEGE 06155]